MMKTLEELKTIVSETPYLQEFVDHYLICLLWSESVYLTDDENADPICADDYFSDWSIDNTGMQSILHDCISFWSQAKELIIDDVWFGSGDCVTQAGHDFCLTRNRHGVGFLDGDWDGATAKQLTVISRQLGVSSLYAYRVDDDDECNNGEGFALSVNN